jgi:hypothetical protein
MEELDRPRQAGVSITVLLCFVPDGHRSRHPPGKEHNAMAMLADSVEVVIGVDTHNHPTPPRYWPGPPAPWDWDDSEIAAAQAYGGVVASLLAAAVTAQVKGRLANQLQAALEHRWLIEQAKGMLMGRERLNAQAAFERLRGAARSSSRRVADVARDVTAGKPLPLAERPPQRQYPPARPDREDQPGPAR